MCTLTYRLTDSGYDLFFNRDEQRSRAQAIPPKVNHDLDAIFPLDPIGKGTWLAVHESGLSLALLNYYQAEKKHCPGSFVSRGEIILKLLKSPGNVIEALLSMQLSDYQPFQLCVFPANLTLKSGNLRSFQWDGLCLTEREQVLPITSSGVDYPAVYQARKIKFELLVDRENPTTEQLLSFHQSQQDDGKLSVKMFREEAKTVSFSHILVREKIELTYLDYLDDSQCYSVIPKRV